jgi:ABC-type multidrug transport system permease subunit
LTIVPYVSGIVLSSAAALLNPSGIQLLWQSALPAAAGGQSGLLWLRYVIPSSAASQESQALLRRNYPWVIGGAILALAFVLLLGRGITIRR